jgi:hypothetical protein
VKDYRRRIEAGQIWTHTEKDREHREVQIMRPERYVGWRVRNIVHGDPTKIGEETVMLATTILHKWKMVKLDG